MNVLHVVAGDLNGGAARGAYWLHLGLRKRGIDSSIFTDSEITYGDNSVISVTSTKRDKLNKIVRENLDYIFTFPYLNKGADRFSTGFFGVDIRKSRTFEDADIVHLHWINGGFFNVKQLKLISKPIIWTIRDMWPMTGGCHVAEALNCKNYRDGCGKCKLLGSNHNLDLSRFVFRRKRKYLNDNITFVAISNWIAEKAKESQLLRNHDLTTISNNILTEEFLPIDKIVARKVLNIKTKKKIILCGASDLSWGYKGFGLFLESIRHLNQENYFLVFFGRVDEVAVRAARFEYRSFGFLQDTVSLRLLYSSADVFVASSIVEPFGKTLAEAMACETPVVCFDTSGPKDIVDHKINGYKAEAFDCADLSRGINWVAEKNAGNHLGQSGRQKVERVFGSEVIADQYIELYKKTLDKSFI